MECFGGQKTAGFLGLLPGDFGMPRPLTTGLDLVFSRPG